MLLWWSFSGTVSIENNKIMSKFKSGFSANRKSSRRQIVPEEQVAHCSTSHFQPEVTYGDCDESSRFIPGSLGGMSPSSRGHTMKECEEQLSQLHKENFNLKLRIYFLEERLGHRGPAAPGTDTGSCEVTLRAEVESLRVELADKQQLLCQAASAIDLVEKKHGEELRRLKGEASSQRVELEGRLAQMHKSSSEQCQQLQDELTRITDLLSRQREDAARGRQPENMTSVGTQCTVDQSERRVAELSRELEARGQQVSEAEQRIKGLEEALCEKQPEIQIKVQELRERDNIIEEKQHQLEQQNRVLVEIQITLAEKQRLIDALNATISARDVKIAQLEAGLALARSSVEAGETRLMDEARELSRARGENEMLKTQLKRMNRSKEERERESPRRRSYVHSRESVSPRNKSLIEEAIEGIWSAPVLRPRDEFSSFEEKENVWKVNESKEKPQQLADQDRKSDRFSEENYLKLEKEHQRGCEAIQGFITRIKHLANEKDALKKEAKRMKLELKELRDSYNKAKWEARQLEANATGVPGTLADVREMTEEENERLWAEVEDKNKKLAQLSLEMDKQIQTLLASVKEKETQLTACETRLATSEGDLIAREKYIKELEGKMSQPSAASSNSDEVVVKRSKLDLHDVIDAKRWDKSIVDDLQDWLNVALEKRESEIASLRHQVEFKDLQIKLLGERLGELGGRGGSFVQHLHVQGGPIPTRAERDDEDRNIELHRLRGELCAAEVAKKNAMNACALLVGRLEELAGFLVSLLHRPDRLGTLDTTHCQYIKQAVQRSVNLSRQLSMTITLDENMFESVPRMDLSLVGRYLEGVGVDDAPISVTSCSTDTLDELCGLDATIEATDLVAKLRSQVETLKLEIRQRDIELNCLVQEHNLIKLSSPLFDCKDDNQGCRSPGVENVDDSTEHARLSELGFLQTRPASRPGREVLSESETWSEPDRQISLARIGLQEEVCPIVRHHHSRTLPEPVESSESSQETAREINRTPGKRRSDALETRRLQARLRGLEQVNEALRTELAILHQLTPRIKSPVETTPVNNPVDNPVTVPANLLEQIKHQREKLESSLFHNDFIRRQLEDAFLSATGCQSDQRTGSTVTDNEKTGFPKNLDMVRTDVTGSTATDNQDMVHAGITGLPKNQDTVCTDITSSISTDNQVIVGAMEAKLRAAEDKVMELEGKLKEVEGLLAESREQAARVAIAEQRCSETHARLSAMQEKVNDLEVQLQKKEQDLREKESLVGEMEGKVMNLNGEVKRLAQEMVDVGVEADRRVAQAELRVKEAKEVLLNKVEGIEKEIASYEEKNRGNETELKEARENLKEAMLQKVEANKVIEMMKIEFSTKIHAFEETQRNLEVQIERTKEDSEKEVERRSKKLEEAERQLGELRWAYKADVEKKIAEVERLGSEVEAGLKRRAEVAEKKVVEVERLGSEVEAGLRHRVEVAEKKVVEVLKKVKDTERLGSDVEAGLRRRVEVAEKKVTEVETRESDLRRKVHESEKRYLDQTVGLRRQQDEAALLSSQAALDRTRLTNEKVRLEQEVRRLEADEGRLVEQLVELRRGSSELEQRLVELQADNAELRVQLDRLRHGQQTHRDNGYSTGRGWSSEAPESSRSPLSSLVLQRGFGRQHSEFSDYVSEDQEFETVVTRSCSSYWITTVTGDRRNLHSPDLGIESDQGRLSSLEANTVSSGDRHGSEPTSAVQTLRHGRRDHNCTAIEEKNVELKRELCQTRRALEETLAQLTASNQRKQNVEKAICKQLQKTHSILMKTRGNLQPENLMLCDDQT